ncbi:MAG: right-handed parallel beta-helix repeat-containing protein [Candidatus Woesearchaeota archaeon]
MDKILKIVLVISLFFFSASFASADCVSGMTTNNEISQYGITWTFDQNYECGQFVNGDYYVVGPVTVTNVDPAPSGGRHGSMINPVIGQAYDDRIGDYSAGDAVSFPATLNPDESLVSTISQTTTDCTISGGDPGVIDLAGACVPYRQNRPWLSTAAVLTIVDSPLDGDYFRPGFNGDDKNYYNADNIRWDILPDLAPTSNTPDDLSYYERGLERPWIMHLSDWSAREIHPRQNMLDYHAKILGFVSNAYLLAFFDIPDKEDLVIRLIQNGIDEYELVQTGHASSSVSKIPILFAGAMLNDQEILNFFNSGLSQTPFREDWMTYYPEDGTSSAVSSIVPEGEGWTGALALFRQDPGTTGEHEKLHPSEWDDIETVYGYSGGGCKRESYRRINSPNWPSMSFMALLLDGKDYWNHDAFFDYSDRFMTEVIDGDYSQALIDACGVSGDSYGPDESIFRDEVWLAYRYDYGCVYTGQDSSTQTRNYDCNGVMVECSLVSQCSDYPNERAWDYDPCRLDCVGEYIDDSYYVSVDGSGSECSSSNPCSLDYAINNLNSGIVVLEDGNYGTLAVNNMDFDTNYLTLTSQNYRGAIFDTIDITGSSYLNVDAVSVIVDPAVNPDPTGYWMEGYDFGIVGSSHHITINDSYFKGFDKYVVNGLHISGSDEIYFSNNKIETVRGESPRISSSSVYVIGNDISDISHNSIIRIMTGCEGTVLQDNVVHNCHNDEGDYYFPTNLIGTSSWHPGTVFAIRSSDILIKNNTIHNCYLAQSIMTYEDDGATVYDYDNIIFVENLIYDTASVRFDNLNPSPSNPVVISNNTFIGVVFMDGTDKYDILQRYKGGPVIILYDENDGEGLYVENNIVVGVWALPNATDPSLHYVEDNNIFFNSGTGPDWADLRKGGNTIFGTWRSDAPSYTLHGNPNYFEDIGFRGATTTYDYSVDGFIQFFENPGLYTGSVGNYADRGRYDLDYTPVLGSDACPDGVITRGHLAGQRCDGLTEEPEGGDDPGDDDPTPCGSTDTSCGYDPNCVNCNSLDGCYSSEYRDYSCSGDDTGCSYVVVPDQGCDCFASNSDEWQNFNIEENTDSFTFTASVTPSSDNMDGVLGLSNGAVEWYTGFVTTIRFNTSGYIDVYDSSRSDYASDSDFQYSAGVEYEIRTVVDLFSQTYDIYITSEGESEVLVADDYPFRNPETSIDSWGIYSYIGSINVCNVGFASSFHNADTNQNNIIEISELNSYVGQWKTSSSINLAQLIEAIELWKNG